MFKFIPWQFWAGLAAVVLGHGVFLAGNAVGKAEGAAKATQAAIERTNESIEGLSSDAEKIAHGFRSCRIAGGVWDYTIHKCGAK
jgi:hypothetical protein